MADIPLELITEILTRIPVKSLIRFKCVSKSWHDHISGPDFIRLHLTRSLEATSGGSLIFIGKDGFSLFSFEFHDDCATQLHYPFKINKNILPHYNLVCSCHGLLCFLLYDLQFSLYNPATRAYKTLPQLERGVNRNMYSRYGFTCMFAYDSATDDYKFIRFATYYIHNVVKLKETHLYSLKSNSWEIIQNPPQDMVGSKTSRGVVTNNSLHWISISENSQVIWCLDLSTQGYREMPLPKQVSNSPKLAVLKGYLHLVTDCLDIWIMREYGVPDSWTQVFKLQTTSLRDIIVGSVVGPYAYSKDGRKIVVGVEGPENFIWCDLECQTATKVQIPGMSVASARFLAETWVESLVPLV